MISGAPDKKRMPDCIDEIVVTNEILAQELLELSAGYSPTLPHAAAAIAPPAGAALHDADAIVAHIEMTDGHGVGVLVRRLFGDCPNVLSIRSQDFYEGRQDFGDRHVRISHGGASRDAAFWGVLEALGGSSVKRILCIPYFPDDARTAVALHAIFNAPLCTYLMDDQNLCAEGIPDGIMDELLARSSLRLGISPQLCVGYELKYGYPMHYMPPLVAKRLILSRLNPPGEASLATKTGVIVGNIWGQRWLDLLRSTVRDSGITLHWYCAGGFRWLSCDKEMLAKDGILPHEGPFLEDDKLVEVLRRSSFAVVPSGTLDDSDDRRFLAQLSFPSRIPYIFATSQTPLLVLGNESTAAAQFVTGVGLGVSAPYERDAFCDAVSYLNRPDVNLTIRRRALVLAGRFADIGASEWIWQSLARGAPIDDRYETLMPAPRPDLTKLVTGRYNRYGQSGMPRLSGERS